MEDFKDVIKEWLEIDDLIKNIQIDLKEKKKRQSKLSEYILAFMNSNDKKVCNIGTIGSVVVKTRKSSSLNKASIQKFFEDYLNLNEEEAKNAMDAMNKAKTIKETSYIKLQKNEN